MSGFNDDLVKNGRKPKAGAPGLEWEQVDYDAAEPGPASSESKPPLLVLESASVDDDAETVDSHSPSSLESRTSHRYSRPAPLRRGSQS
ncbi:hypothetical protein DL93DRAFT_2082680 [Clavulina sp. PMI_390]|nr:hypothetical protein DL93DRAFT_2082680 [Clavulina sp. PMI_390]